MANQKISELTTATSPSVNDVLPIVNGGSTKKITASSLMSNTLSASTIALSGAKVYKNIQLSLYPEASIGDANNCNVFLHAANGDIAIGDSRTGQTFRISTNSVRSLNLGNIFLGAGAGCGVKKGVYYGQPVRNIAIGSRAGESLGGADDSSCGGRANYNCNNTMVGHYAGRGLCVDGLYTARDNVVMGGNAFQRAQSQACKNVIIGVCAGAYLYKSMGNVVIGNCALPCFVDATCPATQYNVVIGTCAGIGLQKASTSNVMIGFCATVGSRYSGQCNYSSIAIGRTTCADSCNSVAMGAFARASANSSIVIGGSSRTRFGASNQIVIGINNCFSYNNVGSNLSGAIVLGSCNRDISTTFVLGSPVFPLSARPDTTLAGQVSSLFVTINGENRRLAIFS